MDYEKAYKDALERAREYLDFYKDNPAQAQKFIDIFPELAESEDERRKGEQKDGEYSPFCQSVKDKIRTYIDNHFIVDTIVKTDVNSIVRAMKEGVMIGKAEQKPADLPSGFYFITPDGERYYSKEFRFGDMKMKVVENEKPVEKQDYSGLNDFERAIHRGFLCAGVENVPVTIINETAKDCLANLYDEQNPEWSEEDEENINSICSYLDSYCRYHEKDGYGVEECKIRKAWLKSLRPHWKPSEEQMRILEDTKARMKLSGYGFCDVLESLYNDLKKLLDDER